MNGVLRLVPCLCLSWALSASAFAQIVGNDVTLSLHALQPEYAVKYGAPSKDSVKAVLDRVFNYLDAVTPAQLINQVNGTVVNEVSQLDTNTVLKSGDFRITSYEWGVTYSGMQRVFETTSDSRYAAYVKGRFNFLAKWVPAIQQRFSLDFIERKRLLTQPIQPRALDDAGAVCAAMIKAQSSGLNLNLRPLIDHYMQYIHASEYRLEDGTFARMRPQKNTIWLDDLYMAVPALAQMGRLSGNPAYFDDAVKQLTSFSARLFNREKGVYMHGWVEGMAHHPEFRWARANGWALMATVELLDVLPAEHPGRAFVMQQFKDHAKGLAAFQDATGLWHQLLDREDSYLETSASAIYAYCLAHGINKGWLDACSYGPAAILGWNAVAAKVNYKGQVEGTCVGTGMAFDPAFYYNRPVNVFAAHGYGPVLLAGAEIYQLLGRFKFGLNDSALQLLN